MQRGFTPIILLVWILVIIFVAGGAYYLGKSQSVKPEAASSSNSAITSQATPIPSSTPDETANWKTYTKQDYEFKYPGDWQLQQGQERNSIFTTVKSMDVYSFDVYQLLNIAVDAPPLTCGGGPGPQPVPLQITEVGNIKTSLDITEFPQDPSSATYSVSVNTSRPISKNGSQFYCISFNFKSDSEGTNEKSIKILDQILSTFKFIQ